MATRKNTYALSDEQRNLVVKMNKKVETAYVRANAKAELLDEMLLGFGKDLGVPEGYRFNLDTGAFLPSEDSSPKSETIVLDTAPNDEAK